MSLDVALLVVTLPVAIVGLVAMLLRGERQVRRLANRLLGDGQTPGALDRLDEVWAETRPNGGSSMWDSINRTEQLLRAHISALHDEAHPWR